MELLLPGAKMPIVVGRQNSIAAVEFAVETGRPIIVVMQREAELTDPEPGDLGKTGTLAPIVYRFLTGNATHNAVGEGHERARITT